MTILILSKKGISVEEAQNPTSIGNIPSYVIRKDGRGVCEVFKRALAIKIAKELIKERLEGVSQ
jgi:hypothetical protein